ncbi:YhcH/YjgK/YiaL family protein [Cohnella sp. AR92]|uniref:YhcH/YjgK/YiaL family protein n=1 Tax=Cohnella sp. AR92 TaxID=648716 RepID=UPI000F8F5BFF|nr:YhcH/YjgK/YiaL family protein [Cohnella sp. AR92]RUS46699.1 DUF386 domain-containing protein [Cohnella sp. AR92]
MLIGKIENWTKERNYAHPVIRRAIDFLDETDFSLLEDGKYPIWGDDMYARIMTIDAKPRAEQSAEKHERFLDIHYLLNGEETIGWQSLACGAEPVRPYEEEQDYALYGALSEESLQAMKPGMYMVLLPDDIHRPGLSETGASVIRKVVVKVDKELL